MNVNILISIFFFFISCAATKEHSSHTDTENRFIEGFKREVFARCISKSYMLKGNDISLSNNFDYGISSNDLMWSLADSVMEKIERDSMEYTSKRLGDITDSLIVKNMYDEGMIGSRTLQFCFDYYESFELDSIAKKKVKNLINN